MIEKKELTFLKNKANELKIETLKMIYNAKSGHIGGSFSIAEILTVLYYKILKINPKDDKWIDRDRVILSKGHCCPILYAILADKGFFDKRELMNLRHINSILQGHPDMKKVKGLDMTSGSLGNGIGIATGMAIACKYNKQESRIYVIVGDGELQEGSNWEAIMFSGNEKLNNMTIIIDKNNYQVDGSTAEINDINPLNDKFIAFKYNVIEIDGHSVEQIINAIEIADKIKDKPTCIIANTIKGKGVSFFENKCEWHGKVPNKDEYVKAMKELEKIEWEIKKK